LVAGSKPRDLRLAWTIDQAAHAALEEELFGKHVLITDHDDWPVAEVITVVFIRLLVLTARDHFGEEGR
jgi:hypothetical protein